MSDSVRAFIAINVSESLLEEFAAVQHDLKESGADVKWTRPGSIHLTLKFLGSISQKSIEDVKKEIDVLVAHHNAFELSLFQVGGFPRLENPRVIWIGIDKGCSQAEAIARDLEEALLKIGFAKEKRPFAAHLTLGRIRSPKGIDRLVSKIKTLDFHPSASSHIDRIILYQSTLTPQGPIYTPLHEAKLV